MANLKPSLFHSFRNFSSEYPSFLRRTISLIASCCSGISTNLAPYLLFESIAKRSRSTQKARARSLIAFHIQNAFSNSLSFGFTDSRQDREKHASVPVGENVTTHIEKVQGIFDC